MVEENQTQNTEERMAEKQLHEGKTQEEAKKEVAQENIEKETGKSFEETKKLATEIMEAQEGFNRQNVGEAAKEMSDIKTEDVQKLQEKMTNSSLASDLANSGLKGFQSAGATTIEQSTKVLSENTKIYGDGEEMNQMIQDVLRKNPNMTQEQVENMSPEELRKLTENTQTTSEEKQEPPKEEPQKPAPELNPEEQPKKTGLYERLKQAAKLGAEKLSHAFMLGKSKDNHQ